MKSWGVGGFRENVFTLSYIRIPFAALQTLQEISALQQWSGVNIFPSESLSYLELSNPFHCISSAFKKAIWERGFVQIKNCLEVLYV